jgi:uncharacterized protein (DUF885 family)
MLLGLSSACATTTDQATLNNSSSVPTAKPPGVTSPEPLTAYEKACDELAAKRFTSSSEKLKAIFDFEWNHQLDAYPEFATDLGDSRGAGRVTDNSLAAVMIRKREEQCPLKLIKSIDPATLKDPSDRLNYDLFRDDVEFELEGLRFPSEFITVTQLGGVHQSVLGTLHDAPLNTIKDFENAIARLNQTPTVVDNDLVRLKEGLARKLTPPRKTLLAVPQQIDPLIRTDLDKNPFYEVFQHLPASISKEDAARIQAEAKRAILERVVPSLKRYKEFLETTYIPGARETLAWSTMPDGQAWYDYLARHYTTTRLTAKEIHEIGLKETERIRGEMLKVMKASGWKKSLPEFFEFLRHDRRFFYQKSEEFLAGYRDLTKRIDPELPKLFGKLPRLPYGVKAVPAHKAKSTSAAYYEGGSLKTGRPGWFVANTYDITNRPKWEMPPLALHEAVPGHHLQIALADELENVPEFRRHSGYGAFTEGWALYAETLGGELGIYKNPYDQMGQLANEMWRACRLVVDTGIHAFGWSREKSIAFMKANMPKPVRDIEVEVDRYIVWPGQALGYKIGELKIRELRTRAEKALGKDFDIRAFHDTVLSDGALPLDALERKIDAWIAARKKGA